MSDAIVEADPSREQQKTSKSSIWRDRLKDKASKLAKREKPVRSQSEQEVSDFLQHPSASSSAARAPRLDTSTIARASEDQPAPTSSYVPPPRVKRRKPAGLHVGFTDKAPEIIGEGGDEADAPTRDVIGAWKDSGMTFEVASPDEPVPLSRTNTLPTPSLLQPGYDPKSRRTSIQRTPTRHTTPDGWNQKRLSMSIEEALVQATANEEPQDPATAVGRGLPPGPAQDVQPLAAHYQETLAANPFTEPPPQTSREPSPFAGENASAVAPTPYQDKVYAPQQLARTSSEDDRGSVSNFVPYHPVREPTLPLIDSGAPFQLDSRRPTLPTVDTASSIKSSSTLQDVSHGMDPSKKQSWKESPTMIEPLRPIPPPHSHSEERTPLANQLGSSDGFPPPRAPPVQDRRARQAAPSNGTTTAAAEAACEDLFSRLQHLRGTFRLASERINDLADKSISSWLRASSWWLLRGKTMLETEIRSNQNKASERPSSRGGDSAVPKQMQCYVDLAKCWWITEEVLPDILNGSNKRSSRQPDRIDGLDNAQLAEVYSEIRKEMQLFALSLEKRNLFPPPALMIQGADPMIWLEYPSLPAGILATTAGLDPRSLCRRLPPGGQGFFSMPVADTGRQFCYGRVFGAVELTGDTDTEDDWHFPCMISILRDREQSHVEFMISSQDGQINTHVQMNKKLGPTWDDVEWKVKTRCLRVKLTKDYGIVVRLFEADFKTLWGIHDYNKRVEADRQPRPNEEVLYKEHVAAFHYIPPPNTQSAFPTQLVKHCQVRLFQMNKIVNDGSGERNVFAGYRMVAVTPPYMKTVSSLSRNLADATPILASNLKGEGGAPALGLVVYDGSKREHVYLTFDNAQHRTVVQNIISGIDPSSDECSSGALAFENFGLSTMGNAPADSGPCVLPSALRWQSLTVVNQGSNIMSAPNMFSNRLRIVLACNFGTVTDRANLGTGDLRIGLDSKDQTLVKLFRPAEQCNLTIVFSEQEVKKDPSALQAIQQSLTTAATLPTARVYQFKSLPALHEFQTLVTGFSVIYDGQANSFAISRRRAVVPIYKRLEATLARVQVLSDESTFQLVAFLEGFAHGRCMNFTLRAQDHYESFSRSGVYFVRFVDAKFALPRREGDESWDMLCLDQVEYPSEHDDIVVGFATEDGE
jgi:hypothetical protein